MLVGTDMWKTYPKSQALRGVSIQVEQGETVGLVGESGSGKSTLARILCCLTKPDAGIVTLDRVRYNTSKQNSYYIPKSQKNFLRMFRKQVQIIFQDSSGSLDPRVTVYKTLEEPLDNYNLGSETEKQEQIRTLLEAVDLDFAVCRRYPHELSGGQRQRVVIARALAVNPEYLLCDEPLSGLDTDTQEHILSLLISLGTQRRLGCLFISHDLALCTRVSAWLYVMFAGKIVERLASKDIQYAAHPYTRSLFEYLFEPNKHSYYAKTGTDFGIADKGCAFQFQCPRVVSLCQEEPQETLVNRERDHWVRCYHPEGMPLLC